MRKLILGFAAMAALATTGLTACGSAPTPPPMPTREEQLRDNKADLESMGFVLTSGPTYESAQMAVDESKKKPPSSKPAKKWDPTTRKLETHKPHTPTLEDPAEFEATFDVLGCNVEADRVVNTTMFLMVNGRKIEFYTLEIEEDDEKVDLLIAGPGAHTRSNAETFVRDAINALPLIERPSCFKP
ncbi:MAG TPA: hypothetical protein VFT87_00225 [Candidatus Saccharimonadales bacterium]|nr:hypothetical protein [Candidatus Saccharimonadales bacterium]